MRIDLTASMLQELGRSNGASEQTKTGAGVRNHIAGADSDIASLATGQQALQQLKIQVDGVPDIRQQKVAALQQAVQSGTYQISPQRIAAAMLADSRLSA